MAGTIIADTWQNGDGTQNYKCRAWVNFNGTGTVAIRASGNVSSITDRATGWYKINFTTAMPDANFSFSNGVGENSNTFIGANEMNSATSLDFYVRDINNITVDEEYVTCCIFR